jgi:oxidoreductase, pyridine nucleotide-disulfide, class I
LVLEKLEKTLAVFVADKGEKVAIIEKSPKMYDGTCINIACIPTKVLAVAANSHSLYKN